jgi:hypothetical protein
MGLRAGLYGIKYNILLPELFIFSITSLDL